MSGPIVHMISSLTASLFASAFDDSVLVNRDYYFTLNLNKFIILFNFWPFFGFYFDSSALKFHKQISSVVKTSFFQLWLLSKVKAYLTAHYF